MTDLPGLGYQKLQRVFPFFLAFDDALVVTSFGPSLVKLIPGLKQGKRVNLLFKLKRPAIPITRDSLLELEGKMVFLMHENILLRGQFEIDTQFLFLGSPVFDSLETMKLNGIQVGDYAAHDPQGDMIQRLSLERMALTEAQDMSFRLERANLKLKRQFQKLGNLTEQLEVIFKNSEYGILSFDETGSIQLINKAAEMLFGFWESEIIGESVARLIADHPAKDNFWNRTGVREAKGRHQSGRIFPIRLSVGKAQAPQGAILIAMVHDISDQKRAEDELTAVSSRLKAMIQNLPHGILVEDEQRRVVLANAAFAKMFGMESDPEQLAGIDCKLVEIPPANLFRKQDMFSLITKTLLEHQQPSVNEIHELLDGRILSRNYIPIFSENKHLGQLWQYQDITATKNAEYATKESEKRMRAILDTALDAILSTNQEGKIVDWNHAATGLFGWEKAEVIGQPLEEILVPESSRGGFRMGLMKLQNERNLQFDRRLEIQALDRSGRVFPCELAVTTLRSEDGILYTAFMRDISDRVRAEEALKSAKQAAESANQAKSQFLARMSHEMRTPLNVVLGMITLMKDSNHNPELADNLDTAAGSGQQLLFLINDFLDQSKIEAGLLEIESVPFDLTELVENIKGLMTAQANRKRVQFKANLNTSEQTSFQGDSHRINQILINLISNAIKFTNAGEVSLTVESEVRDGRHHLLFRVRDTGDGIAPEKQAQIFEQFYQVDPTNKPKFGGTGLGLAICQSLAELMGGKVWLHESILGQGSEFRCLIPAKPVAMITKAIPRAEASKSKTRARILLVDDNRNNLAVAQRLLERLGHWVFPVQSGMEAIKAFRAMPFDLIFLDLEMPDVDGFAVTQKIRAWESRNNKEPMPIIALTAHALDETRAECIEVGMNDFIGKPVIPDDLKTMVVKWVQNTPLVVFIDDDMDAIHILMNYVSSLKNLRCCFFKTGGEALAFLEKGGVDLIVCDYHLPDMMGTDLAHKVRETDQTPILFHSGMDKGLYHHQVKDLDWISFLTKPVAKQRFLKRVMEMIPNLAATTDQVEIEVEVDPELLQLAHSYLKNRRGDIAKIKAWIQAGEFAEIRRVGHNVKGTAGTYGFEELSEIANGLETHAKLEDKRKLLELLEMMDQHLVKVKIV